ncbi:DUF4369 domain-containing protein [Bacteroides caecigallinarum]|uniref:DUF4369 domain-containing protein n=1 Tax=Bacteroides sp. ET336 TaxID=2972459 RepID=UPI0021AC8D30|nr:DUF4369 domain-containing protein [Bacteroides sp. ET336]MCR8893024.1 DUF4369 domain-containing protein [Bacteroides sp. ET336]MDN0053609.1 DUF4369 domain-containing protein [Bacteroides caecigallinarum]MDN0057521.1 DUF4369 domain-containing protein [Bacteroides caecigallinarum]
MKTKHLFVILMLFSFLVSCTEQQCIIHGTTTDVKDGDYMYITEYLDNTYLDSAVVMNGKFTFKLPKASEEDFLPKVIVPAVGNVPSVAMVFTQDSEVLYIRDSQNGIFDMYGSPYNDLFRIENFKTDSISHVLGHLDNLRLKNSTLTQEQKDSITLKMNELIKEDSILNIQRIERNIDNIVGAYCLYISRHSINKETFQKLFERLPKKFASSKHFDDIRK